MITDEEIYHAFDTLGKIINFAYKYGYHQHGVIEYLQDFISVITLEDEILEKDLQEKAHVG